MKGLSKINNLGFNGAHLFYNLSITPGLPDMLVK